MLNPLSEELLIFHVAHLAVVVCPYTLFQGPFYILQYTLEWFYAFLHLSEALAFLAFAGCHSSLLLHFAIIHSSIHFKKSA